MNKIERELKLSKEYYLEYYENTDLIKLSTDNVARVEAMIHFNSSYDLEFEKYCKELSDVLLGKTKLNKDDYKELVAKTIITIDDENSTHLNSDGVGREQITERIMGLSKPELVRCLEDPVGTKYKLFKLIAKETVAEGKSSKGNARRSRTNPSFASKFCHYMCFYMFPGRREQDNYSIYDSIVRKAIPRYADYFGLDVKKKDMTDYIYYQGVIDKIIKVSDSKISRNGFDHILWYSYK